MYNLELEEAKRRILENGYKKILVQLPDGLKPMAAEIVDSLSKTGASVYIWFSSCFGACDLPVHLDLFDFFIAFGHNKFNREDGW